MEMDKYLEILSAQIRNSRARAMAVKEIRDHIEDQTQMYESRGMTREEARREAVRQMGDPVETGEGLDRIHRPDMDWKLLGWIAAFSILGLIIQYVCFYGLKDMAGSSEGAFIRQCIYTAAGLALMTGVCLCDYSILGNYGDLMGVCFLGGIVVICSLDIFPRENGAYGYLKYMMYLFVPVYGGILWRRRGRGYRGIAAGFLWIAAAFITGTKFVGGGFSITANAVAACGVMLLMALWKDWFGVSRRAGLIMAPVLVGGACLLLLSGLRSYQIRRLKVLFYPEAYANEAGYFTYNIRKIISVLSMNRNTYGVLGQKGLLEFWNHCGIPGGYMLLQSAIILGLGKTMVLCGIYGAFFFYLFSMAIREKNSLGRLTGIGCAAVLAAETVQNILYNAGIGLTYSGGIPFLSYGGIHTMVIYVILGILLSIYRYRRLVWDSGAQEHGKEGKRQGIQIGAYVIRVEKRESHLQP